MLLAMVRVRETRVHVCDEDSGWNKILSEDKTEMYNVQVFLQCEQL